MKQNITICMDTELVEILRKQGKISETINEAMWNKFDNPQYREMSLGRKKEDLARNMAAIEGELEALEGKRLLAIEQAEEMEEKAKQELRDQIKAEQNTPERIARRKSLELWVEDQKNKAKTK